MKRIALLITIAACKKEDSSPPVETTVAPSTSASAALSEVAEFGMIGLLTADVDASDADFDASAQGNMWGDPIAESFGAGGLGLSGAGDGGRGEGIGVLGYEAGAGPGFGSGGHGRLGGAHTVGSPTISEGQMTVLGRLPPEVIRRIVRQNYGRFKLCYLEGLRHDPRVAGMVATQFVIDRSGAVASVRREPSTTLTDAEVVACIGRGFSNLSFPEPEGGIVTVVYPIILSPPAAP